MSANALRQELIASLGEVYQLKAFGALEDLLQGESLILQWLAAHRTEDIYPSDLSRELRLSRSRITGALNSLRGKGLVEMQHSETDRRRVRGDLPESLLFPFAESHQCEGLALSGGPEPVF